jgi:hypothetical protein
MRFYVFAYVEERFFEVIGDLGSKWYACQWDACDAVKVSEARFLGYVLGVGVADFSKASGKLGITRKSM